MELVILSDKKYARRRIPQVSINSNLRRVTFNRTAMNLMINHFNSEFEEILILVDEDRKDAFWIRPAKEDHPDARRLNKTAGGTRSCSCTFLLKKFGLEEIKTKNFRICLDSKNDAFIVDLNLGE